MEFNERIFEKKIGSRDWVDEVSSIAEKETLLDNKRTLLTTYPFNREMGTYFDNLKERDLLKDSFWESVDSYEDPVVNDFIFLKTVQNVFKGLRTDDIKIVLREDPNALIPDVLIHFVKLYGNTFTRSFNKREGYHIYLDEIWGKLERILNYPMMIEYLESSILTTNSFGIYHYNKTLAKPVSFSTYARYYKRFGQEYRNRKSRGLTLETCLLGISNDVNISSSLEHFRKYRNR
jgi:hypothetical protein